MGVADMLEKGGRCELEYESFKKLAVASSSMRAEGEVKPLAQRARSAPLARRARRAPRWAPPAGPMFLYREVSRD
jgi:hypothetical protein